MVTGAVDRAELLLLLWGHGRVLGLAHPVGQPGDRSVLRGEGPARAGVLREWGVGRCQVEVELPLIGRWVFVMEQRGGEADQSLWLGVQTSTLTCVQITLEPTTKTQTNSDAVIQNQGYTDTHTSIGYQYRYQFWV